MSCKFSFSGLVASSFMGLSFRLGGWGESRHFTGMDRPALKQVSESTKSGGVNVFHGSYFSASKPLNATQLNGEVL